MNNSRVIKKHQNKQLIYDPKKIIDKIYRRTTKLKKTVRITDER